MACGKGRGNVVAILSVCESREEQIMLYVSFNSGFALSCHSPQANEAVKKYHRVQCTLCFQIDQV